MAQPSSPAVVNLRLNHGLRFLLLIPILLAILGGWFATRWYLGNTISEAASTGDTPNLDLARLAVRWAPGDSFVYWRLGILAQRNFSADNLDETVRDFEMAVRLSPNDFRYWDELGRALEAAGNSELAEHALRRATDLAPNYYYPRWHLGNLLLREGKLEEAFPHLFRAANANTELWPQVFNLAWQAYDADVDRIANEACSTPPVRVGFAIYLVGVKRYDDSVRLWKSLSLDSKAQLRPGGFELRRLLFEAKQFRSALEITRDLESEAGETLAAEHIINGGFENKIVIPASRTFSWSIGTGAQAQISIANLGHTGQHSLRVVFSAPNRLDRVNVQQTIVVDPNTQYHFESYARTERLNSASTPVVMVLDAADGTVLATSTPLPSGTNDWQKLSFDFKTRNSDGITVVIGRLPCSVGDICPVFGTVWYDDFNLQRGGGSVTSNRGTTGAGRDGNNTTSR